MALFGNSVLGYVIFLGTFIEAGLLIILLMTGSTKSISKGFGLLTPPLPLSLGLGPCHLCRLIEKPLFED